MKTAWIMVVILGCAASLYAQPGPDTLWTRTYGWSGNDTAFGLQQTFDGGFVLGGTATIPGTVPQTDGFLIKTDGLGQMQAWRTYGGSGNDGIYSVLQLADGGYVAAGYLEVTGYPVAASCFRTNAAGDALWIHTGNYQETTSRFSRVTLWSDTLLVLAWTARYLTSGVINVCYSICTINNQGWYGVAFSGGIGTRSRANFAFSLHDTAIVTAGMMEVPTDSCFATLWFSTSSYWYQRRYGGYPFEDEFNDYVIAADGLVLAGRSSQGMLLCKVDFAGNLLWLQRYVNPYSGSARAIIPAIGGGYVIAGSCPTPANGNDMYLAKIGEDGAILWQCSYGGPSDERAFDVVQTPDGGFVLAGYTDSWGSGGTDWYVVKTQRDPQLSSAPIADLLPSDYRITAFPNPFNPATEIAFNLPTTGQVSLRVFDLLGREVTVLRDGFVEAGNHRVMFNGGGLASGIYFARLDAGSFSQTKKLMLLK